MDEVTFVVEILESEKGLLCDNFDDGSWNATLLVALDKGQEVLAEGFKYDAYMRGLRTLVAE